MKEKWDHFFYRINLEGSPKQLALFRILAGAQIIYASQSKVFEYLLEVGKYQKVKTVFPAFVNNLIVEHLVFIQYTVTILAVFLVLGLFTRAILPALTVSFIILFSFYYRGANAPIQWLYLWFPLIILCFSKSHYVWSLDRILFKKGIDKVDFQQFRWPIEMMRVWFVYIYFFAGLAKVFPITNGLGWLNGVTSQKIFYFRFLDSPLHYIFGQPLFNYSENHMLFAGLSVTALLLELCTFILLLTSRYNLLILGALFMMHFMLYLCGVAGFAQAALVLGIALFPPSWFPYKSS